MYAALSADGSKNPRQSAASVSPCFPSHSPCLSGCKLPFQASKINIYTVNVDLGRLKWKQGRVDGFLEVIHISQGSFHLERIARQLKLLLGRLAVSCPPFRIRSRTQTTDDVEVVPAEP